VTLLKRIGVVGAGAVLIVAMSLLPDTTARERIGDSGTVLFRLNLWKVGLGMVKHQPLFGAGFGSFGANLADHQDELTVGAHVAIAATPVHNTTLSVLVELGAVGLFLYLGAFWAMLRMARAGMYRLWGGAEALWVTVFVGVYLLQAQFAFAHEPATNQLLFGVLGAIAGLRAAEPGPAPPSRAALRVVSARGSVNGRRLLRVT
jgi:O-antigen ligase